MCSYDMLDFVVSAVLRFCRFSISDRFVFHIFDKPSAYEQTERLENSNLFLFDYPIFNIENLT